VSQLDVTIIVSVVHENFRGDCYLGLMKNAMVRVVPICDKMMINFSGTPLDSSVGLVRVIEMSSQGKDVDGQD